MVLLDRTHLRFFTRESLADLFHGAGYEVRKWQRVLTDPFATEMELREEDYSLYLREAARSDIEAMTYQFVVSAYPARPTGNGRTLSSPTSSAERNLLDELNGAIDSLHEQINTALAERDSLLAQRDSALAQRDSTLAHLDEVVAQKDEAIAGLLGDIGSIQGSTGYRMLAKYHGAARRLFPAGSRRGRPYGLLSSFARRVVADRRRGGRDNRNERAPENKHEGTEDKR